MKRVVDHPLNIIFFIQKMLILRNFYLNRKLFNIKIFKFNICGIKRGESKSDNLEFFQITSQDIFKKIQIFLDRKFKKIEIWFNK